MRSSVCTRLIVFGLSVAMLTGCSRDPNVRKQKYFESGQRYYSEGKYREAIIQFLNATQVDSGFAAAHYQLAQSYLKLQDWQHAYQEVGRTLELQPDNYKAHADMANMLAADYVSTANPSDISTAEEHTDLLLKKQPNDPDSHIAAANLLNAERKFPEAIAEIQKAIALGPKRGDSYLNLALVQTKVGQFDSAEANYKKAIDLNAQGENARLALAAFYQSRGRYPEAEQQVQLVIAANPKDVNARASLAKLYMSQGKRVEAEQFLSQVKRDFPKDSVAYRMLGDYYFAEGDLDKATAEYGSLHQQHPKDPEVSRNYVQLLILKNRLPEADQLNEAMLKSNGKDDQALTFRGEIQLQRNQINEAVQTLQGVVTRNPDMAVAHYQLGLALSRLGEPDRAGAEWQEAIRLRPNMVEADRALAALSLQKSDMAGLERYASAIIQLQPASPDGYALRSVSFMARKRYPAAELDARKAVEVAPQSPAGYLEMGDLNSLNHKNSEAINWYEQALSHDSNSIDALRGLANVYVSQKQPDKAISAINSHITTSPNNSSFYDLLGSVMLTKKDYSGAETAFRKAVQLNKNNVDAYVKLGQSQLARGATNETLGTYAEATAANPKDPGLYVLTGIAYEHMHELDKAKAAYQTALQLKPDNPQASNNLAYVLLETNGSVDQALQLAQTARRNMPESSNVADTLGWAFYKKGVYESAIGMFQEAIKLAAKNKETDNPTYHYHLGLAYARTERPGLARQHLEHVLKIDPKYSGADDVKKQLAQLKS
ncbi:MAG TPA: tetratricopeptide repeat protein [Terriglobales bacterium]|nr:tetratricopeptide repeat protein [Terriglobales bacterium]